MSMQGDKYNRETTLAPPRKHYDASSDSTMSRAINRFRKAVDAKAFQGEITGAMLDGEIGAAAAYNAIDDELDAAKANLLRVISRRVNK